MLGGGFFNSSFRENYSRVAISIGETGLTPRDPESKGSLRTVQRGPEYAKRSSNLDNTLFCNESLEALRPRTARTHKTSKPRKSLGGRIAGAVCRNQMLVKCMFKGGGSVPGQRWVPSAPATPRPFTPVNPIKELQQVEAWSHCGVKADCANLQGSDTVSWPELKKILQHCGLKLRPAEFEEFMCKLKQVSGAKYSIGYEAFVEFIKRLDSDVEFNLTHTEQRMAQELQVANARARRPMTARTSSSRSNSNSSQRQKRCNNAGCGSMSIGGMNGCGAAPLSRSIFSRDRRT